MWTVLSSIFNLIQKPRNEKKLRGNEDRPPITAALQEQIRYELEQFNQAEEEQDLSRFILKEHDTEETIWYCFIKGRKGEPHEGAKYKLKIKFTTKFPQEPPIFAFEQPIPYHPNICPKGGEICIQNLCWKLTTKVFQRIEFIEYLLYTPNFKSVLNSESQTLHQKNKALYQQKVKEQALKSKSKYQNE